MMRKLGVIRSLTYKYTQIKQTIIDNKSSLNDSAGLMTEKGISKLNNGLNGDLPSWNLTPKYIERFDACNDSIKDLEIKYAKLQELQQRRSMLKFDDNENKQLNKSIRALKGEMTIKLKECEGIIKEILSQQKGESMEDQIKANIKQNLLTKVGDFTKKFKLNEEQYMKKYQDLVGDDLNITQTEENDKDKGKENDKRNGNFFLQENIDLRLVQRDSELTGLLTSIDELAQIFKDLQVLVMEQGTILDRIDYNIESAVDSTTEAHKVLVKTNKEMKKNCARNAILIMIIIIFVLAVLLIFKFI